MLLKEIICLTTCQFAVSLPIASWKAPQEGNIYGKLSCDTTKVQQYLASIRKSTGKKVTITHFIGKIIAHVLAKHKGLNGRIVLGRYKPFDTVSVTFLVQINDGTNLAKVKIENANNKSLIDICDELTKRSNRVRKNADDDFNKSMLLIKSLPTWLIRPLLNTIGYLTSILGLKLPALGLEAFPFGACIITSIGMLGLEEVYVPPTPFACVPTYLAITKIKNQVVVEDNSMVIRPMINLMITADHRFIDGFEAALIAKMLQHYFAHPEEI